LQREFDVSRKQADELLLQVNEELLKGDNLATVKRLLQTAKKKAGVDVDVNYCSGVVCERNSLLNLAVINRRRAVARWLVEECGADIETVDRGHFTPLLNAAYNGDLWMVRFMLGKGANRAAIGVTHSSKGFVLDFKGYDAEGWARKFGFLEVAKEIKIGIK
jgi:ankyrin repeat protein